MNNPRKMEDGVKRYCINGWREGKGYFLSFGFTDDEIARMENGEIITIGHNVFSIEIE